MPSAPTSVTLLLAVLTCVVHGKMFNLPMKEPNPDGSPTVIDLNEQHSIELLQHWMDQAFSGLMAAVASKKMKNLPDEVKEDLYNCSKNANTVIYFSAHAQCVTKVMDEEQLHKAKTADAPGKSPSDTTKAHIRNKKKKNKTNRVPKYRTSQTRLERYGPIDRTKTSTTTTTTAAPIVENEMDGDEEHEWVGSFKLRAKRGVISKDSYSLVGNEKTPFSIIARQLTDAVRVMKKKDTKNKKDWHTVIAEVQAEAEKIKAKKTVKKMIAKRLQSIQEQAESDPHRPLAMKELDDFEEQNDEEEMLSEARRLEKNLTTEQKLMRQPMHLLREGIRLGMMAAGGDTSDFENKTLKLVSPRLMSLFPEEEEDSKEVSVLSPSLFSLHNKGKGLEKATSLVDGFGLVKSQDTQEWLNFVMEAAGVTDAVEYLKEEKIKKHEVEAMRSPTGQPLYFTKENVTKMYGEHELKKITQFEKLQETFTKDQIHEQKENGYSVMTKEQLELLYGPDSPYNCSKTLERLRNVSRDDMHAHIESNIRMLSNQSSFALRQKDIVASPVLFTPLVFQSALLSQPVILSPLVFSPSILSPAVLGPIILGPWVFVPVILSPRVLTPLIVNPLIFSPVVLSPLVLHPFILSPGVFNPFVLSPLVLSPFILSPQVFTPLILTPMVLNPLILNPMAGSPLVLSPFVLSPLILSPQFVSAVVLSPYALSPLIESKLVAAEVVLSPSWLS